MPAFVKTPKDEKRWARAKAIVEKQRKKAESGFEDKDWALTNKIYHNMSAAVAAGVVAGDLPFWVARLQSVLTAHHEAEINAATVSGLKRLATVVGKLISASRTGSPLPNLASILEKTTQELESVLDNSKGK